jgi:hypothetical protein
VSPFLHREDLNLTNDVEPVSKVMFERMDDFKFIAAYDVYSRTWDDQQGVDEQRRLNDLISQLFNEEISYPRFYREIEQYKGPLGRPEEFQRTRIQGERKRDYRRKEQRRSRQKRHKR